MMESILFQVDKISSETHKKTLESVKT